MKTISKLILSAAGLAALVGCGDSSSKSNDEKLNYRANSVPNKMIILSQKKLEPIRRYISAGGRTRDMTADEKENFTRALKAMYINGGK